MLSTIFGLQVSTRLYIMRCFTNGFLGVSLQVELLLMSNILELGGTVTAVKIPGLRRTVIELSNIPGLLDYLSKGVCK